MNSVVPIANPPIASANTDSPNGVPRVAAAVPGVVVLVMLTPVCRCAAPRVNPRSQPREASASLKVRDGRITAAALSASGR